MNLYEIATHYRQLIEMLSGDEEIPESQINDLLAANNDALGIKVSQVCAVIKSMRAEADANRAIAKRHDKRADTLDNGAGRLEQWLIVCLKAAGVTEAGTVEHSCKLPKPRASLDIIDAEAIPAEFWRVIPESRQIDKTAAKAAIESGVVVPGCSLKFNQTVKVL